MIRTVSIQNFRALRDVTAKLQPLTVLVGVNDSGKSSFLDAVRHGQTEFPREDWWREGPDKPVITRHKADGSSFKGSTEKFRLPSSGVAMSCPGIPESRQSGAPALEPDGNNMAAVLDSVYRRDRDRFKQIETHLQRFVPGLERVDIDTPRASDRSVSLHIEGGLHIDGHQLSTGARMLFFFVTLAHHPNSPDVLLIEEPENGVHPQRLKDIVDLLRRLTQGNLNGHSVQVILTTHSPYLLDHVRLPEDQVLVFRRQDDGRRTASEVNQEGLKDFLGEFMLGEVWFNQGEEGLLAARQ